MSVKKKRKIIKRTLVKEIRRSDSSVCEDVVKQNNDPDCTGTLSCIAINGNAILMSCVFLMVPEQKTRLTSLKINECFDGWLCCDFLR